MAIIEMQSPPIEDDASRHDPRKRQQILDGARTVFLQKGFDAASMNDIARAAGVSKGTLYVYFADKERLFVDLISTEKREELFSVVKLDFDDHDVEKVLARFGHDLTQILTRPYYIQAMRTVFSIVNRMPEIGREFYGCGPKLCIDHLAQYLDAQVRAGVLEIEDTAAAAGHFVELASGLMRPLLFGSIDTPSSEELLARAETATRFFVKVYAPTKISARSVAVAPKSGAMVDA